MCKQKSNLTIEYFGRGVEDFAHKTNKLLKIKVLKEDPNDKIVYIHTFKCVSTYCSSQNPSLFSLKHLYKMMVYSHFIFNNDSFDPYYTDAQTKIKRHTFYFVFIDGLFVFVLFCKKRDLSGSIFYSSP